MCVLINGFKSPEIDQVSFREHLCMALARALVLPRASAMQASKDSRSRGRSWVFTHPGHDDETIERLKAVICERMCVGREVGEGGYKHLQGYVRFKQPAAFSWWKNQFPKAHVELQGRKGSTVIASTEADATAYCRKEGDVVIDKGVDHDEITDKGLPRNEEAIMVMKEIKAGVRYGVIRERHPLFVFWNRRFVMDYMRDEKWAKDYPDQDPTN